MSTVRTLTIAALLFASSISQAAHPASGMRWDCSRLGAPSHREFANAFDFDSYAFARQAQPRLYTEVRRQCRRGATAVLLVRKPSREIEVRPIAER